MCRRRRMSAAQARDALIAESSSRTGKRTNLLSRCSRSRALSTSASSRAGRPLPGAYNFVRHHPRPEVPCRQCHTKLQCNWGAALDRLLTFESRRQDALAGRNGVTLHNATTQDRFRLATICGDSGGMIYRSAYSGFTAAPCSKKYLWPLQWQDILGCAGWRHAAGLTASAEVCSVGPILVRSTSDRPISRLGMHD